MSQSAAEVIKSMPVTEYKLRRLLARAVGSSTMRVEDGEFLDLMPDPPIDFLRDSPDDIEKAIIARLFWTMDTQSCTQPSNDSSVPPTVSSGGTG